MSDRDSEAEEVADLSDPAVTTKYQSAALIANKALELAISKCAPDADIYELCQAVDAFITEETGKLYNKKGDAKLEKGIAFPTCISVNELCGHFSPMKGESQALKKGDVVKIDLAAHFDGFVAQCAHTIVLSDEPVTGRAADVVHAAWTTAEAVLRTVKVGNTNADVTAVIKQCASEFECNPVQGVLSHECKKHVVDGNRCIINCETHEEQVEDFEFGMNEVYCLDLLVSSGEGKPKETEIRSTVFKRALENTYQLKTQKARQFLGEVGQKFPTLPFSLRAFDETVARVGVSEATRHELLHTYPVLKEKPGDFVAQFKFTLLLLPGGTKKITGLPFTQGPALKTEHAVKNEDLKKLLASSANPKKKKNKK
jgi:curved DNA binding protein